MRTTLDIPSELLDEIMELTGAATKNQAVREVLEEQIKLIKRKRLLSMKGTIDLDLDLDRLRERDS
ncbi:type II toxin-antitoxin system VapB family antitoxin [Algoriphagus antarcticus]|uniref:VapB protein of antitoxin of type II toxin-antitoxin system n=1 Tax=Algoriphagus antarcticus TaxID=238540 RepID=A0A3E0DX13_9BACT|nr:type II toxin-antitoxin system VapB family antitoxin [Algoriphagus antarcticus]REG87054.1 VapB protein of antitoxin of type II toxin-antitoxin system [Algoriphagus antarcticus]